MPHGDDYKIPSDLADKLGVEFLNSKDTASLIKFFSEKSIRGLPDEELKSQLHKANENMEDNSKVLMDKRTFTFGEKAVGLTFNHGEGELFHAINQAKQTCANAIDQMNEARNKSESGEYKALATIAIRKLQSAQMDMVKCLTWKD